MSLFYTGKGDGGVSDLGKGKKIDKTCVEIASLGDLDELNSLIGVVKNQPISAEFRTILDGVQESLFIIQANVAQFMFPEFKAPVFSDEKVAAVERLIDAFEAHVQPEKGFVVAGANSIAGWFDFLRAVARRGERSVIGFSRTHTLPPAILAYLNRLSSLFFAMARVAAKDAGEKERHPGYK